MTTIELLLSLLTLLLLILWGCCCYYCFCMHYNTTALQTNNAIGTFRYLNCVIKALIDYFADSSWQQNIRLTAHVYTRTNMYAPFI